MNPLISVIVPVYNVEDYLISCMDSIINQTLENIEVICINDGSTDESLKILKEYEKKDERVKVYSKQNSGQGTARNFGLENAIGEYVLFVDSDDWIDIETCEILYDVAKSKELDLLIFLATNFDDEIIYNGNALKPKVEVYDIADNVISPAHYTLKYTNNTKCGTAKVTATAKTDDTEYTGSHEMEFLISPAKAVIKSLADGKNSLTITVKDQKASGVKGYEVSYRIKGSSAWKTKNFKATSNKLVLKNLKKGKIYQVRVRATEGYHEELDGHNFGEYSAVNTSSRIGIAPSKPVIRSLKAGKGSLTVKLKGETPAGVKSYKVQYRIKGTKKWTTKTFKASGTKLVIRKLTKGKNYQVRIRAVKHSGLVSKYSKTKTGKKIK